LSLTSDSRHGESREPVHDQASEPLAQPRLSERELLVLELSSRGASAKQVAHQLSIGIETVHTLLDRARRKLDATGKTHAVATAIRLGLLRP